MAPEDIRSRAQIIRLSDRLLGEMAGCSENTANRTLTGKTDPRTSTLNGIRSALVAEEIRLLRHLAALHPDIATLKEPQKEAAE